MDGDFNRISTEPIKEKIIKVREKAVKNTISKETSAEGRIILPGFSLLPILQNALGDRTWDQ